jgi:required for meiotic nuclear division protein 1
MAVVPVNAFGFASTFKLRELEPVFTEVAQARVTKDQLVATFAEGCWALAYDFGAVVFVGVDAKAQQRIIGNIAKKLPSEKHAPMTEDFFIETGAAAYEVRFDRVLVPKLTLEIADIIALVLAQSVAMDYYSRDVDEIEVVTDQVANELRQKGKLRRSVRQLTQFIGLCIATRNDIISTLALFDKPDVTWENEQLDRLWNGLYRMLELDDRYRTLEAKLRMFQDNLVVLAELARARHTFSVEVIIVVLILMEMLIMLWQILGATGHF